MKRNCYHCQLQTICHVHNGLNDIMGKSGSNFAANDDIAEQCDCEASIKDIHSVIAMACKKFTSYPTETS